MINSRKSYCIICIANYCRSPVFEYLFKERFGDLYEFYSAGLNPYLSSHMDHRSRIYLESKNIKNIFHNPKEITRKMLNYFDHFLAVDLFTLHSLCLKFPKYKNKFILSTHHLPQIDIVDPYKFKNNEDYFKVMEDINLAVNTINLNNFDMNP